MGASRARGVTARYPRIYTLGRTHLHLSCRYLYARLGILSHAHTHTRTRGQMWIADGRRDICKICKPHTHLKGDASGTIHARGMSLCFSCELWFRNTKGSKGGKRRRKNFSIHKPLSAMHLRLPLANFAK